MLRFPTKAEVATENQRRMDRLAGPTRIYKSHDTAGINDRSEPIDIKVAIKLLNKEMAPEVIKLKVKILTPVGNRPPISRSSGRLSGDVDKGRAPLRTG